MNSDGSPSFEIFFGSPGSGKSHLVRYTVYEDLKNHRVSDIHVFTGNPQNEEYNYLPKNRIHGHPETWTKDIEKLIKKRRSGAATADLPIWTFIFDDWTGKIDWRQGIYKQLVSDYRQLRLILRAVCHYAFTMVPLTRESCMKAAIFSQQGKPSIKALFESYGSTAFATYNDWNDYMKEATNRDRKEFIWYDKNPKPGNKMFQPMVCPPVIPQFSVTIQEDDDQEEQSAEGES